MQYWPENEGEEPLTLGDLTITLKSEKEEEEHEYVIRNITIQHGQVNVNQQSNMHKHIMYEKFYGVH